MRKIKEKIARCLNPACKSWSMPGVKFCDPCLTGMCNGKVSVYRMGLVRRKDLIWDRTRWNRQIKAMVFLILITSVPVVAQTTFKLYLITENPPIYFGEKYEGVSHFTIHFFIGIWRPDYSVVAAIAIEMADTINGRFDARDWGARLTGCFVGYIFNRYLFSHEPSN